MGQAVASVPLFLVGKAWTDLFLSDEEGTGDLVGMEVPKELTVQAQFVAFLNPILMALACVVFFSFCTHLAYDTKTALVSTLALGLATAMWVYSKRYWPHPLLTLLVLCAVYALYRYRCSGVSWCLPLAGAAAGFAVFTRSESLVMIPWLCLYVALLGRKNGERERALDLVCRVGLFVTPVLAFLALIAALNWLHFGHLLASGYSGEARAFRTPLLTGLRGNLLSIGRSVFLFSPPLVLFLFTIADFYRRHRMESILILLVAISYLVTYSKWWSWSGGVCWGPRFLLPIVPLMMLPAGIAIERVRCSRPARAGLIVVAAAGVIVQLLGVAVPLFNETYERTFGPSFRDRMHFRHSQIVVHAQEILNGRIEIWFVKSGYHVLGGICLLLCAVACFILLVREGALRAKRPDDTSNNCIERT